MTQEQSAKEMVEYLIEQGMKPEEISEAMQGRVSSRTIYRWLRGGSEPQQRSNVDALRTVVQSRKATPPLAADK